MHVASADNGFEYAFDPGLKLVTVRPVGTPDYTTSFQTIVKIATALEFGPQCRILCDFRNIAYTPSMEEAHTFGHLLGLPYVFRNHRLALVVVQKAQQRVAQAIATIASAEGCPTAVFDTSEAAQRWLLAPD